MGVEPTGRFRASEESSGDYYIVGPLPGQYASISNALDAVYSDYGSTPFVHQVVVVLETNALAGAVALDSAVWPLAPAAGAELVVRGLCGGTALTGSLDVRGISHVRLERLRLSGETTITNASSATLRNSVAASPVTFFGVSGAVVAGCTFVYTNGLAAVAVTNSPGALFRDNLVLGGGTACGAVLDAATVTADHNAWWPVEPPVLGSGDVFAAPLVDPADFCIADPSSPLVRAGAPVTGLNADIGGMRRYASAPCIGAYEYGIEETERDTEGRVSRRIFNGRACEYAYDAYGRLVSFADIAAGSTAAYAYDFAGRRVGKTVGDARTAMVYDWGGHDVVYETHDANGDGDLNDSGDYRRTYWVLPEIDRRIGFVDEHPGGATETYWYVCDGNGSVHAIVDNEGNIVNRYAYDSFGVIDWDYSYETVPNRYTFQGREYDHERGDYYFRNRVYLPEWGLFSGPDMNLAAGPYGEAHGMMSYVFCGNDPWRYADPMGLDSMRVQYWYEKGIAGAFWNRRNFAVYNAMEARQEIGSLVEEHKSCVNVHAPWMVAGAVNSVLDLAGAVSSMPLCVLNAGSSSGEFAGAVDNYASGNGTLLDVANTTPIFGSVGEGIGTSTWDVWKNPSLETVARAWGAYGEGVLTGCASIKIKQTLFDGPRIDTPTRSVADSRPVSQETPQVSRSRIQGSLGEMAIRRRLENSRTLDLVGEQVQIATPGVGSHRTVDFLVRGKKSHVLHIIEVKTGGATRSTMQRLKDQLIADPLSRTYFRGDRLSPDYVRGSLTGSIRTYEVNASRLTH